MAAAITIKSIQKQQSRFHVEFSVALSGNYPKPEVLDFTAATLPPGQTLPTQQPPETIDVHGTTGSGYRYEAAPGASFDANELRVFETGAAVAGPQEELGAAAYPAAVSADVLIGHATFPALQ